MIEAYKKYCEFISAKPLDLAGQCIAMFVSRIIIFAMIVNLWFEMLYAGLDLSDIKNTILYPLPFYAPHFVLAWLHTRGAE